MYQAAYVGNKNLDPALIPQNMHPLSNYCREFEQTSGYLSAINIHC